MSDVLSALGIDLEELEWQDLALCSGMPTNMFYDEYESENGVARVVDEACLSCPVMAQCLDRGVENNEWGVWGGIYLNSGKPDMNRNAHKSQEVWEQIKERIGESVL
jgi:hypothetical protein